MSELKRGHSEDLDKLISLIEAANQARGDELRKIDGKVAEI
jgi:hypothetical protein